VTGDSSGGGDDPDRKPPGELPAPPDESAPEDERSADGLFGPLVHSPFVSDEPVDPMLLALRSIAEPMAEAQKVESQEKTKRAEIDARAGTQRNTTNVALAKHNVVVATVGLGMLMVFLLVLVALKEVQLAEKIGAGVLGFLGGLGYGRTKPAKDD
jgi:hypothetical protein